MTRDNIVTAERLAKIETSLDYQGKKLDSIENKLDEFIESSDKRYAQKDEFVLLRNIIYGFIGTCAITLVGFALKHLFFP